MLVRHAAGQLFQQYRPHIEWYGNRRVDTLVAESNGYNDRTWLLGGYPHTEALRITERPTLWRTFSSIIPIGLRRSRCERPSPG